MELYQRIAEALESRLAGMSSLTGPDDDPEQGELRYYQRDTFKKIVNFAKGQPLQGYVKRPTGTGKTVIFGNVIKALMPLRDELEDSRNTEQNFLILTPTVHLAEQTKESLVKVCGIPEEDIGVYRSDGKPEQFAAALSSRIQVMTIDSYMSLCLHRQDISKDDYPFVILDEIDSMTGPQSAKAIQGLLRNPKRTVLGFTATDRYLCRSGWRTVGDTFFNGCPPIDTVTIGQADERKEIAKVKNVIFASNIESGVEENIVTTNRDFNTRELKMTSDIEGRDDAAIKAVMEYQDPENGRKLADLKQIWFCNDVAHAKNVAEGIEKSAKARGVNMEDYPYGYAVPVRGLMPRMDHIDKVTGEKKLGLMSILELHKQGVIPVVCSADLLIRGYDVPNTDVCCMLRQTRSPTLMEQAGGRVTRKNPLDPDKVAYVINFFDRDNTTALAFTDVIDGPCVHNNMHYDSDELHTRRANAEAGEAKPLAPLAATDEKPTFEPIDMIQLEKMRQQRIPPKDAYMITAAELSRRTNLGLRTSHRVMTRIEEALATIEPGAKEVEVDIGSDYRHRIITIPLNKIGYCQRYRNPNPDIYIDVSVLEQIVPMLVGNPKQDVPHVKLSEIARQIGMEVSEWAKLYALGGKILEGWEAAKAKQKESFSVDHKGVTMTFNVSEVSRVHVGGLNSALALDAKHIDVIRGMFAPEKTSEAPIVFGEIIAQTGIARGTVNALRGKIKAACEEAKALGKTEFTIAHGKGEQHASITLACDDVQYVVTTSSPRTLALKPPAIRALKDTFGKAPCAAIE